MFLANSEKGINQDGAGGGFRDFKGGVGCLVHRDYLTPSHIPL